MNGMTRTIGMVTPRYAPAIGGVERHAEMLVRGLVARGFAVEVITTDPGKTLPPVEEIDGVVVRRFPTVAKDAVFFVAPELGVWLLRNAHRYTLLHAHSYHTPLAFQAAIAARQAGIPFIFTPHYHGTGHSTLRTLIHRPYRIIGNWLLNEAEKVVCVSKVEQALITQHFGTAIDTIVIPNGVEQKYLIPPNTPASPKTGRQVLTVGRLDHYKQADRTAKALPYLPRCYALTIIGNGPARAEIQHLMPTSTPRLRLPGQVSEEALMMAYRTADVFVTMSRQESFGMTVLEAAVSGARVVASDIPAHREVATYLPPGRVTFVDVDCSPMQLARAIETAAASGRTSTSDGEFVPTWNGAADTLREVYHEAQPKLGTPGPWHE